MGEKNMSGLNPAYVELARIENLRHQLVAQPTQAIVGRNYGAKIDMTAVAFDAVKTRDAWTIKDLQRKMRIKEDAAQTLLRGLVKEGHLTSRVLHGEAIYEWPDRNPFKPLPYSQFRGGRCY
tara:strand:- start:65 stop:430 length:366 start_codon:yes stop_codon:yes gene_type:complete